MIDRLVLYLLGRLLYVAGWCLVLPLLVTVYLSEYRITEFLVPMLTSLALGFALTKGEENPYKGRISIMEGVSVIGFGFVLLCILGAFPFWIAGYGPMDSFFESVSGFTTTGTTVLGNLSLVPTELLLWRSLMQWTGGMLILVTVSIIVPQIGTDAARIFNGGLYGSATERIAPRIIRSIHIIVKLYAGLTLACMACLYMAGMTAFEALNYALCVISTGGFSIYNNESIHFQKPLIFFFMFVFMVLAGGSYSLYVTASREGWRRFYRDTEFKCYLLLLLVMGMYISTDLFLNTRLSLTESFGSGFFQTASILSTTGYKIADYNAWPVFSRCCLFLMMFVGGCSGSASTGMKVFRIVVLLKYTWSELKRNIHVRMVSAVKMSGQLVPDSVLAIVPRFFFLYMFIFYIGTLLVAASCSELTVFNAASISASCLAGIQGSFGAVSGVAGYSQLPVLTKAVACVLMLFGRLELFIFCVLLHSDFWREPFRRGR